MSETTLFTSGKIAPRLLRFALLALVVTVLMIFLTKPFAILMQTPKEAFDKTCMYVHICSAGTVFITAYNMMGGVFRGMGDSKTPLLTVLVACIINIFGDLLFVAVFHMAASGKSLWLYHADAHGFFSVFERLCCPKYRSRKI